MAVPFKFMGVEVTFWKHKQIWEVTKSILLTLYFIAVLYFLNTSDKLSPSVSVCVFQSCMSVLAIYLFSLLMNTVVTNSSSGFLNKSLSHFLCVSLIGERYLHRHWEWNWGWEEYLCDESTCYRLCSAPDFYLSHAFLVILDSALLLYDSTS